MVQQITVNPNEIHQENFLKAAVLNRSTKRAMTNSFPRAHFPWSSNSRKRAKNEMLKLMKFFSNKYFLKEVI